MTLSPGSNIPVRLIKLEKSRTNLIRSISNYLRVDTA